MSSLLQTLPDNLFSFFILAAEESETSTLVKTEVAAVILIAIAAAVAVAARRFQFPSTVALVVAGFGATALGDVVQVDVSPDLILFLLVPPLLFEATLHLPWAKLKADLFPVLNQALLGTFVGTMVIGSLVHYTLDLRWEAAFAFGALISATDPVAVIAFFKSLGTPKRLSVLVEGESLFNDAVAVVAFGLAISAASGAGFSASSAFADFLIISTGGIAVGLSLGYVVSEVVLARVDDGLIETTTTIALAFGSFLLAEEFGAVIGRDDLHFSGILAVVTAGLVQGNMGVHNTSPSTRETLEHSWELITFLVNSMVFLFIGLTIRPADLIAELDAVAIAVVGVIAMRVVLTYGLSFVSGVIRPQRTIPMFYQHVMLWGGLRGAISLALALTVSEKVFDAETAQTIRVMTFGVVLFTLLVQGTTIAGLIRRLGLAGKDDTVLEQQRFQSRVVMKRAGQSEVAKLGADGVVDDNMADALARAYQTDISTEIAGMVDHTQAFPEVESAMLFQARRDALSAERSALNEAVFSGIVDGEIGREMTHGIVNILAALDVIEERSDGDLTASIDFTNLEDGLEEVAVGELAWLRTVLEGSQGTE